MEWANGLAGARSQGGLRGTSRCQRAVHGTPLPPARAAAPRRRRRRARRTGTNEDVLNTVVVPASTTSPPTTAPRRRGTCRWERRPVHSPLASRRPTQPSLGPCSGQAVRPLRDPAFSSHCGRCDPPVVGPMQRHRRFDARHREILRRRPLPSLGAAFRLSSVDVRHVDPDPSNVLDATVERVRPALAL